MITVSSVRIIQLLITSFGLQCLQIVKTANDIKPLPLQGLQPMSGTGWTGGAGCLPAALMALRHVNERSDILDGYNLTYSWVDTQVCCAVEHTIKQRKNV